MPQLKDAIMDLHDEAEQHGPLHAIREACIDEAGYAAVLKRLHGFVEPVEEALARTLPPSEELPLPLPYEALRRLPDIKQDLVVLGVDAATHHTLPRCETLPPLDHAAAAVGVLYLMEGSRLGGLVLAEALGRCLGLEPCRGAAYFGSCGKDPRALWGTFAPALEHYATAPDPTAAPSRSARVIQGARQGFIALNAWLEAES